MDATEPRASAAVDLLERHLSAIPSRLGVMRLVQFDHDSTGLRKIRRAIAEGLVMLIEDNGMQIHNGLDEAIADVKAAGYTVTKRRAKRAPESTTEPTRGTTA